MCLLLLIERRWRPPRVNRNRNLQTMERLSTVKRRAPAYLERNINVLQQKQHYELLLQPNNESTTFANRGLEKLTNLYQAKLVITTITLSTDIFPWISPPRIMQITLLKETGPTRGDQWVRCTGARFCGRGPGGARNCIKTRNLLKDTRDW